MHWQGAGTEQSTTRSRRRRWFRVRVETEEGVYTGRLRSEGPRGTLHETIADDRAYLSLWDATAEATGSRDEYVAIHKGSIRCVVLLGEEDARAARAGR
jgi:hypothetical protein